MSDEQDPAATKQQRLQGLLKEYNIQFVRSSQDDTPTSLRHEFDLIRKIEQTDPSILQNNVARARALVRNVENCSSFEVNEVQWRWEVENRLFSILKEPMICSTCEKRLWRAGIEFPIDLEDDAFMEKLKKRRDKREICGCRVPRFQSTVFFSGQPAPDHIFNYKIGKMVQYEPGLRKRVPKGKLPDLVLGLTNSPKFEKILDAPFKGQTNEAETVASVLKTDLFASTSGMIFPFLVLEAKQGRALDSSHDIVRQMALPAYEMLRMQTRLLKMSAVEGRGEQLPRVWLASSKAEIWKFYTGTAIETVGGGYIYKIYHMWTGDISTEIGALKLILLLDGIFDWARDIYRMNIYDHLSSLAATSEPGRAWSRLTMTPLSEALEPGRAWSRLTMTPLSEVLENFRGLTSTIENLPTIPEYPGRVQKYRCGWVVDARQAILSGGGLLITATNMMDLFGNFKHPDQARAFARRLWELLCRESLYFPSEDILDRVRKLWMRETYEERPGSNTPIYVQFETHQYLDLFWEPKRTLTFVAITGDSIPKLFKLAGYDTNATQSIIDIRKARLRIPEEELLKEIEMSHSLVSTADLNLYESISRRQVWCKGVLFTPGQCLFQSDRTFSADYGGCFQYIFNMYNVGTRLPSESFLKLWHKSEPERFSSLDRKSILVIGDTDRRDWHQVEDEHVAPPLCLFVFRETSAISRSQIKQQLERELRGGKFYYTSLKGKHYDDSGYYGDNAVFSKQSTSENGPLLLRTESKPEFRPRENADSLLSSWIEELSDNTNRRGGSSDGEPQGTPDPSDGERDEEVKIKEDDQVFEINSISEHSESNKDASHDQSSEDFEDSE